MATGTRAKQTAKKPTARAKKEPASEAGVSYDQFKEYEGQRYTGMKIGRTHSWNYDSGRWKEKKITPDLWEISYAVTKRRAGRAPEGSGVPVGTEYHWYVLAHQNVAKINANDYTTSLAGLKFKIAHKRADNEKWSATPKTQRRRMVKFLKDVIADLEAQDEREIAAEVSKAEEKTAKAEVKTAKVVKASKMEKASKVEKALKVEKASEKASKAKAPATAKKAIRKTTRAAVRRRAAPTRSTRARTGARRA